MYSISLWYDRHTRCWVCQLLDSEGNQVGEAEYSHAKPVRTKETLLKDMMELNSKSINSLNP